MTPLQQKIMDVLFKNSGGIKELALITEVNTMVYGSVLDFDIALTALARNKDIGILVYTWHMSEEEDAKREKRFIYTP